MKRKTAAFSRPHYKALSRVLYLTYPSYRPKGGSEHFMHRFIRESMANMLGEDNPRFDKKRFLAACVQDGDRP